MARTTEELPLKFNTFLPLRKSLHGTDPIKLFSLVTLVRYSSGRAKLETLFEQFSQAILDLDGRPLWNFLCCWHGFEYLGVGG